MLVDVIAVEVVGPYSLELTFETGERKRINLKPRLFGPIFEPLLDPAYFAQVRLKYGTITWPNGADFDPEFLYEHESESAAKYLPGQLAIPVEAITQTHSGHPVRIPQGSPVSEKWVVGDVTVGRDWLAERPHSRQLFGLTLPTAFKGLGTFQTSHVEPVLTPDYHAKDVSHVG